MKLSTIAFLVLPTVTVAGSSTFALKKGEYVRIQCAADQLKQITSTTVVTWVCQSAGPQPPDPGPGPGPDPQPPAQCAPPKPGSLYPYQEQKLPREQEFVNVVSNTTRVYYFNSNDYRNATGRISVAPTPRPSGRPSNSNLTVLSECIGDTEVTDKQRACWAAGYQNNVSWKVGAGSSTVCGLKPNTRYRINIAPKNPVTGRDTCGGKCSIVVNTGKS